LQGIDKVRKRYLMAAAAHNLGRLMRELFGMGTPRGLQKAAEALDELLLASHLATIAIWSVVAVIWQHVTRSRRIPAIQAPARRCRAGWRREHGDTSFSTGC
jgi:hypothetical protein